MLKKTILSGVGLLFLSSPLAAAAFDLPLEAEETPRKFQNWTIEGTGATKDFDFEGIVALNNCSGSLVRFEESKDSDPGMVLTNGHCLGFLDPGEVIFNQRNNRQFRFLDTEANTVGRVRATKILYATMTDTDMALYELSKSFAEIEDQINVRPLILAKDRASEGVGIEIVSGYWRRGYRCALDSFIFELREGRWSFTDSIKYTQPGCNVIGGTSGSPIIEAGTRMVIGVNNTGNESGRRCSLNNPCEVDEQGEVTVDRGAGYGQQTYWIYSCLDTQLQLDLDLESCQLPK